MLEVAKDLMDLFDMTYDDSGLQYTEDRAFNDFRYALIIYMCWGTYNCC